MKKTVFTGSGVAIITPFTEDGIDYPVLGELIERQIAGKTDAIIICGTTGESSTMTDEEHVEAIRFTVEKAAGRIPVVAGSGSNDTRYAIGLSREAEAAGADALLHVTPYYNKTTQPGLIAHFTAIAESTSLPVILYNVPSRTNLNIAPATIIQLSKISNIVAIKECNIEQAPEYMGRVADGFSLYSGDDGMAVPYMSLGGKGVISVMANLIPEDTHNLIQYCLDSDYTKAAALQCKSAPLCKALFCEVSPIPVKAALNMMGIAVGSCRLPLLDISECGGAILRKAMLDYGITLKE